MIDDFGRVERRELLSGGKRATAEVWLYTYAYEAVHGTCRTLFLTFPAQRHQGVPCSARYRRFELAHSFDASGTSKTYEETNTLVQTRCL